MGKALVVDDSRAVRTILSRMLIDLGYQVHQAGDGYRALEILDGEHSDIELALVDWNMPVMNGMELLQRLRADRRHASLVVVMVTTETEAQHMTAAIEAGANEYVMKPFTREILLDKLQLARMSF